MYQELLGPNIVFLMDMTNCYLKNAVLTCTKHWIFLNISDFANAWL